MCMNICVCKNTYVCLNAYIYMYIHNYRHIRYILIYEYLEKRIALWGIPCYWLESRDDPGHENQDENSNFEKASLWDWNCPLYRPDNDSGDDNGDDDDNDDGINIDNLIISFLKALHLKNISFRRSFCHPWNTGGYKLEMTVIQINSVLSLTSSFLLELIRAACWSKPQPSKLALPTYTYLHRHTYSY
jgi:hypothetical protein